MLKVDPKDDMFFTATMAEVLEAQGRLDDALTVYKILLVASPGDAGLEQSVARLLHRAAKRAGGANHAG